jgi:hypothetical protein
MQQECAHDGWSQSENQRSGHGGPSAGTGDCCHRGPCCPSSSVFRTLAFRACTVNGFWIN